MPSFVPLRAFDWRSRGLVHFSAEQAPTLQSDDPPKNGPDPLVFQRARDRSQSGPSIRLPLLSCHTGENLRVFPVATKIPPAPARYRRWREQASHPRTGHDLAASLAGEGYYPIYRTHAFPAGTSTSDLVHDDAWDGAPRVPFFGPGGAASCSQRREALEKMPHQSDKAPAGRHGKRSSVVNRCRLSGASRPRRKREFLPPPKKAGCPRVAPQRLAILLPASSAVTGTMQQEGSHSDARQHLGRWLG